MDLSDGEDDDEETQKLLAQIRALEAFQAQAMTGLTSSVRFKIEMKTLQSKMKILPLQK